MVPSGDLAITMTANSVTEQPPCEPGPNGSVVCHGQAVKSASGAPRGACDAGGLYRRVTVDLSPITELPVCVVAPRPYSAIAFCRESKLLVRAEVGRKEAQSADRTDSSTCRLFDRQETLVSDTVSELALGIISPSPYCATCLHCEAEIRAPGDNRETTEAADRRAHLYR